MRHFTLHRMRIIFLLMASCLRRFSFHRADEAAHGTELCASPGFQITQSKHADLACPQSVGATTMSHGARQQPSTSLPTSPDVGTTHLAKEIAPSPAAEVHGQGGHPCRWVPACRCSSTAPVTSPELHFPSEQPLLAGTGQPSVTHAKDSEAT